MFDHIFLWLQRYFDDLFLTISTEYLFISFLLSLLYLRFLCLLLEVSDELSLPGLSASQVFCMSVCQSVSLPSLFVYPKTPI